MRILIAFATIIFSTHVCRSQMLLNAGDTFTYQFRLEGVTCFVQEPAGNPQSGRVVISLAAGTFGAGDKLLFEVFENSTAEIPILSEVVDPAVPGSTETNFEIVAEFTGLADLAGAVRFTMLSGSAVLDHFVLHHTEASPYPSFSYDCFYTVSPLPGAATALLTFDDIYTPEGDFFNLHMGTPYRGVTFHFAAVANGSLRAFSQHASDYWETDGSGPFLTPHSGEVALFNPGGGTLSFSTDRILTGLWVARPNLLPTGVGGAEDLTLTAYADRTPVRSLSIHLEDTTPIFWDTSSLLFVSGITQYTITPRFPGMVTGYFVADDFQFAPRSLRDLCPCDESRNHRGGYKQCVRAATSAFGEEGVLTREQAKSTVKSGDQSECAGQK